MTQNQNFNLPTNSREMLAAMARMYNHDLTIFESVLWETEVFELYPDEVIMRAFKAYMESGDTNSRFMPRYGDIKKLLSHDENVLQKLLNLLRTHSAYKAPDLTHEPLLSFLIEELGGWVQVCAEFPDPKENERAFDLYQKRLTLAQSSAKNRLSVHNEQPSPLRSISNCTKSKELSYDEKILSVSNRNN